MLSNGNYEVVLFPLTGVDNELWIYQQVKVMVFFLLMKKVS